MIKKNALSFYQKEYLYNLYYLINTLGCKWEFIPFCNKNYNNGTNLDYRDFSIKNKYLLMAQENKTKLAEDILKNGIIFPFFAFNLNYNNKISIAQGKHRIFSLLLYSKNNNCLIDKPFLWIELPQSSKIFIPKNTLCTYGLKTDSIKKIEMDITDSQTLYQLLDFLGSSISTPFFNNSSFQPNPIFQNENLFRQFIESPLDENNILFKYCTEIDTPLVKKEMEEE